MYDKNMREMKREFSDKECLSMAVFAINATVGLEVLCPMLLVFGVIPLPTRKHHRLPNGPCRED